MERYARINSLLPFLRRGGGNQYSDDMVRPSQVMFFLAFSAFVFEAIVMVFLSYMPPLSMGVELIVDASLLTLFLFPFIYLLSFRPLVTQVNKSQKIARELEELNNDLDSKVREKTQRLRRINEELTLAIEQRREVEEKLDVTQGVMVTQDKMASVGQLAAGVAHEINNPVGFVTSNLNTLQNYFLKIVDFTQSQAQDISHEERQKLQKKLKIDFILEDIPELIKESLDGTERISEIVKNLKTFSRSDEEKQAVFFNINDCIENTLKIIWNELKYKATITKQLAELPQTKCFPLQLSQVFMNILVNAAHSIEKQGTIAISSWHEDEMIYIAISDSGCGIKEEHIGSLFEPFFTTKDVGKGTGLGLSISHDIVKEHNGKISVDSKIGHGTTFTIQLPVVNE